MNMPLAKFSSPQVPEVMPRERLFELLDAARRQQMAALVWGPPGTGKTALVSSYVKCRNLPCLWYQVDAGDEDPAAFFNCFSSAAERCFRIPAALPRALESCATMDWHLFSHKYFRQLYKELTAPFVIVLDNFQNLAIESAIQNIVRIACDEIPAGGHVVIVSRDDCPKALARMQSHRTLKIIHAADLALTLEETCQLINLYGGPESSTMNPADLHAHTAGWVTGLMTILHQSMHYKQGFFYRSEQNAAAHAYFETEVFMKLPPGWRDILLRCAFFPEMTMNQFSQITGMPENDAILHELVRKNLFITRHEHDDQASTYHFHPMFRQFLVHQAEKQFDSKALSSLCLASADSLISEGKLDCSMELLEQTGNWHRMAESIVEAAPRLRAQGRMTSVTHWIKKLPADLIQKNPWLMYWRGTALALSNSIESRLLLEMAYRGFSEIDELTGMALSWAGIIQANSCMHRDLPQIDYWINEFNKRIRNRLECLPSNIRVIVTLGFFMILSIRQPLHPDIAYWLNQVQQLIASETCAGERPLLLQNLAIHHILRGEHADAEIILTEYLSAAPNPEDLSLNTLVRQVNHATIALHLGLYQHCLQSINSGLLVAESIGFHLLDPILLSHGALMSLNRGELSRADSFLAALGQSRTDPSSLDLGAYYAATAWRKFYAGQSALALQLFAKSITAAKTRGALYFLAAKYLGFGLLLHLCGKSADALPQLELGRNLGRHTGNASIGYAYHLFSAYVASGLCNQRKAHAHLSAGLSIGREHGYMYFLFFPGQVIAELCRMALESNIETSYVRALIERNRLTANPAWLLAESWPWPIRIYTLGRFAVVKQGEALRSSGKAQKKPLELLKAMLAFGGRNVPEVKLADALWPDAEGDAATQSLATTLFRLRKLVGEHVIIRQDSRLTLDSSVCWVDCWAFERLANAEMHASPNASNVRLEKMKKLYQGPFLDSEEYAPWITPMRERLSACLGRLSSAG